MQQEILLNVNSKETRCALLKNGKLSDLTIEKHHERQITGNIYKGRVTNILRNIQSAFIDIGEEDNGFIHISDIIQNTKRYEAVFDLDFGLDHDLNKVNEDDENLDINDLLKQEQHVLVQVVKEPIGSKGARLTSNLSIPGRYLVLLPNSPHCGVSRKIDDQSHRDHLKKIIRSFEIPNGMGLICRTASRNATADMLYDEAQELLKTWHEIIEQFNQTEGSSLLFQETDLIKRSVMKAIDRKYDRILVDDYQTHQQCKKYYQRFGDEHEVKIELYRDKALMFDRFNVEKEIEKALRRKIWLSSGGYLYFETTEAMVTIDVNSGKGTGKSANDVEESLVKINLEAAEEIARQLRLRNLGGLIICDFIDMRSRKNQRRVLDKLKEVMKSDSAKCTILGMSAFGLVEMTRQRSRSSLKQMLYRPCPYCHGSGDIKKHETVAIEIERSIKKAILIHQNYKLKIVIHPLLHHYLLEGDYDLIEAKAKELKATLEWDTSDEIHVNDYQIYSVANQTIIEV